MPRDWGTLLRRMRGVLPMFWVMLSMTTGGRRGLVFVDIMTDDGVWWLYVMLEEELEVLLELRAEDVLR